MATRRRATSNAQPTETPAAAPIAGPVVAMADRQFGPAGSGFYRHGAVALGGGRAVWSNVGSKRVGWLSLSDGAFTELFPFESYATAVGTNGAAVVGIKGGDFVVLDPAVGKKPVRVPGAQEHCQQIAITAGHLVAVQHGEAGCVFIHDCSSGTSTLQCPSGSFVQLAPTGHAAMIADDAVVVLPPPWTTTHTWPLPPLTGVDPLQRDGARALGIASDGSRVAVLTYDAAYVLDGSSVVRLPCPSPSSEIAEGPMRGHVYAHTWVRPLPHGQVVVLDKIRARHNGNDCEEVVATIYDVATAAVRAVHRVKLYDNVDFNLAGSIAIDDHMVLLNQNRCIDFVRAA